MGNENLDALNKTMSYFLSTQKHILSIQNKKNKDF